MIIEVERLVQELIFFSRLELYKYVCKLHRWKLIADVCIFLNEAKSLLSSPGKMIGEHYKIIGIAQAEKIRHKRYLL